MMRCCICAGSKLPRRKPPPPPPPCPPCPPPPPLPPPVSCANRLPVPKASVAAIAHNVIIRVNFIEFPVVIVCFADSARALPFNWFDFPLQGTCHPGNR